MSRTKKAPPLADVLASLPTIGVGRSVETHVEARRRLRDGRTVPELDAIAEAIVEADAAGGAPQMGWLLIRLAEDDNTAMKAAIAVPGSPLPATPFLDAMNRRGSRTMSPTTKKVGNVGEHGKPAKPAKDTAAKPATVRASKSERGAAARAESKRLHNKRGPGRKITDAELHDYVAKVRKEYPESTSSVELEYAYWIEKLAVSNGGRWNRAWDGLPVEDKAAGKAQTASVIAAVAESAKSGPNAEATKATAAKKAPAAKKAGAASAPLKKPPAPRRRLAAVPSA